MVVELDDNCTFLARKEDETVVETRKEIEIGRTLSERVERMKAPWCAMNGLLMVREAIEEQFHHPIRDLSHSLYYLSSDGQHA